MEKPDNIDQLILQELNGENSVENSRYLAEWRKASPKNQRIFDELEKFWNSQSGKSAEVDEAWAKMEAILGNTSDFSPLKTPPKITHLYYQHHENPESLAAWKIAAAVILLVISSAFGYYFVIQGQKSAKNQLAQVEMIEKTTKLGEKLTLKLADGTIVKMNSGSTLRFPKEFGPHERKIEFEGEGFFEVEKDAKRPFIITINKIQTKVLGTSFNIKAYSGEPNAQISLVTGKLAVNLEENNETGQSKIILSPGEEATYSKENQGLIKRNFNQEKTLAWKNKTIYFENADIKEIAKTLERWYGVTVIINRPENIEADIYGKFVDKSLEKVLEGLSLSAKFQFTIHDKQVIISPKK
jgi:transmembrane sensor